jgi:cyclase
MITSRRAFLRDSAALGLASVLPWQKDIARLFTAAQSEMYLLRRNVGVFVNRGGTIGWLFNEAGTVIVDSQFPDSAKELIQRIKAKGDRPIYTLINTHHHGDHSGGNIAFKGIAKQVVAHQNSKLNQERVAKERGKEASQLYPDVTFVESWSETYGDETVTITYHGAAHTNGDTVTHFENANIAHMGDLLFNRRFPYIDRKSGASIKNWIAVLRELYNKFDKDTLFIFGHAGNGYNITGSLADLQAKREYLEALLEFMAKMVNEGKSPADLGDLKEIPGAPQWQGKGIARNIKAAYEELTAQK